MCLTTVPLLVSGKSVFSRWMQRVHSVFGPCAVSMLLATCCLDFFCLYSFPSIVDFFQHFSPFVFFSVHTTAGLVLCLIMMISCAFFACLPFDDKCLFPRLDGRDVAFMFISFKDRHPL